MGLGGRGVDSGPRPSRHRRHLRAGTTSRRAAEAQEARTEARKLYGEFFRIEHETTTQAQYRIHGVKPVNNNEMLEIVARFQSASYQVVIVSPKATGDKVFELGTLVIDLATSTANSDASDRLMPQIKKRRGELAVLMRDDLDPHLRRPRWSWPRRQVPRV